MCISYVFTPSLLYVLFQWIPKLDNLSNGNSSGKHRYISQNYQQILTVLLLEFIVCIDQTGLLSKSQLCFLFIIYYCHRNQPKNIYCGDKERWQSTKRDWAFTFISTAHIHSHIHFIWLLLSNLHLHMCIWHHMTYAVLLHLYIKPTKHQTSQPELIAPIPKTIRLPFTILNWNIQHLQNTLDMSVLPKLCYMLETLKKSNSFVCSIY